MYCDMHTGIHNHVYMLLTFKIIEQKLVNVLQFIGFNLHTVSLTPLKEVLTHMARLYTKKLMLLQEEKLSGGYAHL